LFNEFLVPVVGIGVLLISVLLLFKIVSNYYLKVPPNQVAIIYGRKNKTKDGVAGYEMLTGGSRLIIPILESVAYLDLSVSSMEIDVVNVPNKDGVLVNVKGNANVKILGDNISLSASCERFLGKTKEEINTIAHRSLEGHLRAIIGRLTVEEIVSDRAIFNQKVLEEAGEDLKKLGLGVDFLTVQEITDENGYVKSLGQTRTAAVKRDAEIGKAEAEKETVIQTTTAKMEGQKRAAENVARISEAEKERDVKQALYFAETEKQKAISEQARPLASAQARQEVITQEIEVDRVRAEKMAVVALAEAKKTENELLSTVIKPAEAQKGADIINAEANKSVTIQNAEGEKQKRELEAQGKAAAILAEGEAEAKVIQLKLEAEAVGISAKADAYKKMDSVGQQLQMLEKFGEVGPSLLDGISKIVAEAAKPLGNVGEIKILDLGGNDGKGGAVNKFANIVPSMLLQMCETMKSSGFDVEDLLKKANIKQQQNTIEIESKPVPEPIVNEVVKKEEHVESEINPDVTKILENITPEQIELIKSFMKK